MTCFAVFESIKKMPTMTDTLLETLGAVITAVILGIDNGRHPLIRRAECIKV